MFLLHHSSYEKEVMMMVMIWDNPSQLIPCTLLSWRITETGVLQSHQQMSTEIRIQCRHTFLEVGQLSGHSYTTICGIAPSPLPCDAGTTMASLTLSCRETEALTLQSEICEASTRSWTTVAGRKLICRAVTHQSHLVNWCTDFSTQVTLLLDLQMSTNKSKRKKKRMGAQTRKPIGVNLNIKASGEMANFSKLLVKSTKWKQPSDARIIVYR